MKHLLLTTIAAVLVVGCGEPSDFHNAAGFGNIEAVKQHLAAGADVNQKDYLRLTPLHYTAAYGHKEIAELLITNGAEVNAMGGRIKWTPLHTAASNGHKEVVDLLIAKGADVNAKDEHGETPLGYANGVVATLLRIHGGKTKKELEAAGN